MSSPSESGDPAVIPSGSPGEGSVPGSPAARKRYPGVEQITYVDRHGQKRKSRTYFIRYHWRGKQHREKTGLTDPKQAFELLCQRKEEMRRGRLVGPRAEKVRLADLEKLVLDDYANRGLATLKAVQLRFRYWAQWFGDVRMMDVTLADLNAAVAARRKGGHPFVRSGRLGPIEAKPAAPGTIFVWLATLKRGYSLAVRSRILTEIPEFPVMSPGRVRKVIIDRSLLLALMEHLPKYLHPVFETALLTGWRKEAVLSREWRHVDLVHGRLTLDGDHAKNDEPIVLPLVGRLLGIFREQHEKALDLGARIGHVIPWCFFYPSNSTNVQAGGRVKDFDHAFNLAREKLGMPHLHFHAIRKGAIRMLRYAGASEHEIMEWVGLKTEAVFRRYDIVDDERMADTARRLEEFYEREPRVAVFKKG
jgi:integrase